MELKRLRKLNELERQKEEEIKRINELKRQKE